MIERQGSTQTRIQARDLRIAYERTVALNIPYLDAEGRIIAVIGHNGSGKSTLLKTILKLLSPKGGQLETSCLTSQTEYTLVPEKHMAFSPENGAVFADVSVESYLKLWCRIKQNSATYYRREGAPILERLEIPPLLHKLGRELSKGQRRRVQIAAGFLLSPKLFLFDEPFDGMDVSQSNSLSSFLEEKVADTNMIISSHRMEVVERLADLIIVLENGKIIATGSIDQVCTELCGQSVLISDLGDLVSGILSELRESFASCLVHSIGEQISVTGGGISLERLSSFLTQRAVTAPHLRLARPSLDDAMRYHLQKIH